VVAVVDGVGRVATGGDAGAGGVVAMVSLAPCSCIGGGLFRPPPVSS
jgi:hypothetical protein